MWSLVIQTMLFVPTYVYIYLISDHKGGTSVTRDLKVALETVRWIGVVLPSEETEYSQFT